MPMQIRGELNHIGEEVFSIRQAAGVLDVEQSRLYTALAHLPLPKLRLVGNGKPVLALPSSLLLKLLDCVDTKEFKKSNCEKRVALLRQTAERVIHLKSSQSDSSTKKIKGLASRLFKKMR